MFIDRDTVYRIDQMINKYIEIEIKKGFLNEFSKSEINLQELSFMAECGVILSESSSHKHRSRALDIATIIASQDINKILNMMASIILGRLKNYRTQDLLQFDEESMIKEGLSPTELLKDILYKKNNTIYIGGKEYTLNDFQFKTYEMINDNKITSISAPTSAGKSFVLKRIVLDLLQRGFKCCVYLVPTRALIQRL
ncbi:hypothetical protein [Paraclostridium bifermentans]|uniref:hypothetical protein n=1 Tax=Paraclostridium bifermentans TaxID=1490 RepID=UPI0022E8A70A|nr:hypothetical protein [Paraclostridium bifermentans]